jgi:hypothetical protein
LAIAKNLSGGGEQLNQTLKSILNKNWRFRSCSIANLVIKCSTNFFQGQMSRLAPLWAPMILIILMGINFFKKIYFYLNIKQSVQTGISSNFDEVIR